MKLIQQQTIQESLTVSYQIEKISKNEIELFKKNLTDYLTKINPAEHEENAKNLVRDFFRDTFYNGKNDINTKGRIDLAIYQHDQPVVIFETKKPSAKTDPDMVQAGNLKAKAMYQLVLYFLEERIQHHNIDIKYLVATNMHEWFIFDAALFNKIFYENKKLVREYTEWQAKAKVSADRDLFYKQIARPVVEESEPQLLYTYFDIRDAEKLIKKNTREADNKLALYFKIFSPRHLLKESARNDSNQLNKEFYNELLHIIGLEEIKDGGKKRIDRKKKDMEEGSLLENTVNILKTRSKLQNIENLNQYGEQEEDQLFSAALELCITWLNRVLFLKLLEGQLITFHRKDPSYAFLNTGKIADFDELDELFFEVLAVPQNKRSASVIRKFGNIPYLNSSLFEASALENSSLRIADLKDRLELSLYAGTVLKDNADKRLRGTKNTLQYLFEFLNAYDFASEDTENVVVETKKDVINASVLGLIFEKINGYKDGSFFTPGFITEYMCRESLRRAVAEKFKGHEASIESFEDVKSYVHKFYKKDDLLSFNHTINNLKICDPAVGSGHFLVSALNELLAIKSELGILLDAEGQPLEYLVKIENDTLITTHRSTNEPFNYLLDKDNTPPPALQKVQHALFHEKQTLIEGCLFGVDINPKSVMICRLRLWIELLKHAYYITDVKGKKGEALELQTLPNIDINIKTGNSLISRFDIKADLGKALRSIKYNINQYRGFVNDYKNATDKETKHGLLKIIEQIKGQFRTEIAKYTDPRVLRIQKLSEELYLKYQGTQLFNSTLTEEQKKKRQKLVDEHEKLVAELEETKNSRIYHNAFEWRFEFPEVLDDNGDFIGFDAVIGNPPYGILPAKNEKEILFTKFPEARKFPDSYCSFILLTKMLLINSGQISLIVPNTFCDLESCDDLRGWLLDKISFERIWETGFAFDNAVVDTLVFFARNITRQSEMITVQIDESIYTRSVNSFLKNDQRKIDYRNTEERNIFLKNILERSIRFGKLAVVKAGVKLYEIGKGTPPQTKEIVKGKPYTKCSPPENGWRNLIRGTDINRYHTQNTNELVQYGPWLAAPRDEETFTGERIIMRRTDDRLLSNIIDDDSICVNSCHVIKLISTSDISYKFILGLLNSRLIQTIFEIQNPQMIGKTFAEIKVIYISLLPIALPQKTSKSHIESMVDKILLLKKKDPTADTTALENEIDQLVYKLYNLTPEEVKIVEGKS